MSHYKCLKKSTYKEDEYALRTIYEEDIELIRLYRNMQMDILRQSEEISKESQKNYFTTVVFPSFEEERPQQILLSITKEGHFIGYAGLVHIDWKAEKAEVSFLLNPDIKEGSGEFKHAFCAVYTLLERIAFHELNLKKLCAEVYEIRPKMMSLLQKAGFVQEGILKRHIFKKGCLFDSYLFARYNMCKRNKALLVTSISKKVPLLCKARQAIVESTTFGTLIGTDSNPQVLGKHFVDTFIATHPFSSIDPHMFLKLCKEHNVAAIIPTRDQDLLFFAKAKELFMKEGIHVFVSNYEDVQKAQDKVLFSEALRKMNLPSIETYTQLSLAPQEHIVLKERYGSGSRNVHCNISRNEVVSFLPSFVHPVFQPYIEGKEFSVDLYRNRNGDIAGSICRSRDLVIDGESQVTTIVHHDEITTLAYKVAAYCNLYGHAVIQFIEDKEKKIHILECNMRFGGASTALCNAGFNSFSYFLSEVEDVALQEKPRISFMQVRYPQDSLLYVYE